MPSPSPGPRLIVNADDFGLSPTVNRDVLALLESGRISSATVLANAPAFEAACEGAREAGFAGCLGVHLNLTEGPPLSDTMAPYCDERGEMAVGARRLSAPGALLTAIAAEFEAQVRRVVDAGITPTHLDSHNHILNSIPFTRVAVRVARKFGIRGMRLSRNAFYQRSAAKVAFKIVLNQTIRLAGMRTTRWFTDVTPYVEHVVAGGAHLPGTVELMCHPGSTETGTADRLDTNTELLSGEGYGRFLDGVRLISYADLANGTA